MFEFEIYVVIERNETLYIITQKNTRIESQKRRKADYSILF